MSVTQTVTDSISRSRNTARHATPDAIRSHQPSHPVADSINTIEVAAPSTVPVGETFTGTVTVEIGAASFGPLINRPDNCVSDTSIGLTGFNTLVGIGFRAPGAVDLNAGCLDAPNVADAAVGQTEITDVAFQLTAPDDPGDYELEVSISGDDSGLLMDQTFLSIEVVGDEPEPPEPPEPPGNGNGNGNGNGSGGIFGRLIDLLRSVLATVETGFDTLGTIIEESVGFLSDVIGEIADLLRRAGGTLRDIVFRAFRFVRNNPLLLAVLILAVFGVAPALGETLLSFTPVGIAREILPFVG